MEKTAGGEISIETIAADLARERYLADDALSTVVFLGLKLGKAIFLEGEPGVGKTELAAALARAHGRQLIRLQCYEGMDSASALYEWNYPRQMLEIRLQEARGEDRQAIGRDIFSADFLLQRPLLAAISSTDAVAPVLLVDEIDRADEAFEAYLLELLSDYQVTIPELGTVTAVHRPVVVLTSNRARDVHDALKRRCLYHWIDFPAPARELDILRARVPGIEGRLAAAIAQFMHRLRDESFYKRPGIAETITWASALMSLGVGSLDKDSVGRTAGCFLKHRRDLEKFSALDLTGVLAEVADAAAAMEAADGR